MKMDSQDKKDIRYLIKEELELGICKFHFMLSHTPAFKEEYFAEMPIFNWLEKKHPKIFEEYRRDIKWEFIGGRKK